MDRKIYNYENLFAWLTYFCSIKKIQKAIRYRHFMMGKINIRWKIIKWLCWKEWGNLWLVGGLGIFEIIWKNFNGSSMSNSATYKKHAQFSIFQKHAQFSFLQKACPIQLLTKKRAQFSGSQKAPNKQKNSPTQSIKFYSNFQHNDDSNKN